MAQGPGAEGEAPARRLGTDSIWPPVYSDLMSLVPGGRICHTVRPQKRASSARLTSPRSPRSATKGAPAARARGRPHAALTHERELIAHPSGLDQPEEVVLVGFDSAHDVNRDAFIPPKRDIIPPGGGAVLSTLSQGPTGSGPDSRQVVFTNLERRPWFTRTSER
jgi:hypothetical protein